MVLDAAALNRDDDSLLFLLVGDGADRERVKRRADDLNLRNVRFLPLLEEPDFRGLLAASGICLVAQQKGVTEIAFPSKIVTYLAAGRPTIASVNPNSEVARIAQESGAGLAVEAGDPDALLAAIRELRVRDSRAMSENAQRYARERWSSHRVLGDLERSLSAVAGSAAGSMMKQGVNQ